MKKDYLTFMLFAALLSLTSCGLLDSKEDLELTDGMLQTRYYHYRNMGNRTYNFIPDGFDRIDGNLFASVSDEAQYYTTLSDGARFNNASWNQFYNPDDQYDRLYIGIHDCNYFLENTGDYIEKLALNRDTITISGKESYKQDIKNMTWMRNEAVVVRAYYYFELMKRYGDIPMMASSAAETYSERIPYGTVADSIVKDIDAVKSGLVVSWVEENLSNEDGRLTLGAANAIKSRILLYAASPLNNESNDREKWVRAAKAAHDIITMERYHLSDSYRDMFLTSATNTNPEVIWALRHSASNKPERLNYPIATQGGGTGICPSYNLVKAYEPGDLRLEATIVKNGDWWNGRQVEIYAGGTDDPSMANASVTGFYLKKFLQPELNLVNNATEIHSWVIFRYAEILLNYAEAMNEAYGPDGKGDMTLSAREAVNAVRFRSGLPEVNASTTDEMRIAIHKERQVELAFEEHRWWDLLRWKEAEKVLNKPIYGVVNTKHDDGRITIGEKIVAYRKFDASKMYRYPIPQTEIVRTHNTIGQNPNW